MLWPGRSSNSQRPGTLRAVLWRWLPLLASLAVLAVYSGSVSNFLSGSGDGPRPMQLQAATISQPQYEPLSENRLQSLEKRLAELQDTVMESFKTARTTQSLLKVLHDRQGTEVASASAALPPAPPVAAAARPSLMQQEDENEWCSDSWVLANINASARVHVEMETAKWFDQLPATLEGLYNDATPKGQYAREPREPEGWKRFDALMPAFPDACELSRVGLKDWDGGKWICGLEKIPDSKERPCVVYSIGSNDQYDFEGVVRETTNCTVETFDCTAEGALPGYMRDRVRFHKICLGNPADADAAAGMKFMTLRQIMAMLGHEYVTLLKADIEGYEFKLFQELLLEDGIELPEQISFELHYETQFEQQAWYHRQRTAGELALLSTRLYSAGYRLLSREDNKFCDHCTELTFARFQCPRVPKSMTTRAQKQARYQLPASIIKHLFFPSQDGIIAVSNESDEERLLRLRRQSKVTAASVVPEITDAMSAAAAPPHDSPSLSEIGRQIQNTDTPRELERAFGHRGQLVVANTVSGLVASTTIAPAMALLDISLLRAQLSRTTFRTAVRQVASDLWSGRTAWSPFVRIIATVYGSTYLVANHVHAYCEESGIDYRLPTIAVTSAVNISALAWKERRFTEMILGRARTMPLGSYGLFALRDSMTITASFVLKNIFRDHLQDHAGFSHRNADLAASLAVPVAAQVVNAPFHMLALDLCARPGAAWASRAATVARSYTSIASGRALRIIPAYGIGGFLNDCIREAMTGVEEHEH